MIQPNLVDIERLGCWIYQTINWDLSSILSCKSLGEVTIEVLNNLLFPNSNSTN